MSFKQRRNFVPFHRHTPSHSGIARISVRQTRKTTGNPQRRRDAWREGSRLCQIETDGRLSRLVS